MPKQTMQTKQWSIYVGSAMQKMKLKLVILSDAENVVTELCIKNGLGEWLFLMLDRNPVNATVNS